MKAWILKGFGRGNLEMSDVAIRRPLENEVMIRVSAVSLNYRDKLIIEKIYNPDMSFPLTQVADGVGTVVECGKNVTRFREGDRVMTQYATRWIDGPPQSGEYLHTLGNTIPGALAEYLVLNEQALVLVPDYLDDTEAATLPCAALTAWYSLVERGNLQRGETVLVQGTGGVSIFGLQISRMLGADVIVTSSSDAKLERAKSLGATHTINYTTTPDWDKTALELTSQKGVDQVLEVAGGGSLIKSLNSLKAFGHIAIIGFLDDMTSDLPLFPVLAKQATLRGISTGPRRALERMNQAFAQFKIHPVIDKVYSFEDALAAYDHLYQGAFGKIVIRGPGH
ncbi:zinc-dependent alcohol dehydrogenase family protein [Pedosphaera parvula]|uniref:Alcohol dehydrogenase zinc-binding domain protein n=1 Tax=Pedosphaera parvula (strain Ellin514) TaxID=320771 RepID=B9XDI1_PEDPL|nr:NAD(P)-dependent alcohol dehydrogenase [Pedosphaera parvula]EEF62127.1 Alcohol dehydrogenase zinc-binding domain protein [Pedosphaera parvula Ellin514]